MRQIVPDDIRHLITEYLPATPSYELAREIAWAVNEIVERQIKTAPYVYGEQSGTEWWSIHLKEPLRARLIRIEKIGDDPGPTPADPTDMT